MRMIVDMSIPESAFPRFVTRKYMAVKKNEVKSPAKRPWSSMTLFVIHAGSWIGITVGYTL